MTYDGRLCLHPYQKIMQILRDNVIDPPIDHMTSRTSMWSRSGIVDIRVAGLNLGYEMR